MPTTSTVAIIVPTLNRPHSLPQCLQSIRAQTYEKWVCIVINQGEPIERVRDKRFVYVDRDARSASQARNIGLAMARAIGVEYVCLIDDDDRIDPTYLEEMAGALMDSPDTMLVACHGTYIGKTFRYDHPSTKLVGSRMARMDAIGDRVFAMQSGQEKHFWRSFDGCKQVNINQTLYHANRDDIGGLRDPSGFH